MLWDKLFGTYAEEREDEPITYGVTVPTTSTNVIYLQASNFDNYYYYITCKKLQGKMS